jgi:rhamnulokinase
VRVEVVHLVGGGAQNALLCQLTADACEVPVVAGPVEAAAYGNVLVQARAAGVLSGGRADLRSLLRGAETRTYLPAR